MEDTRLGFVTEAKRNLRKWANLTGGNYFLTPEEVAEGCDVVFLCVGNDEDVRSVVTGEDGLLKSLKPGFHYR